MQPYWYRYKFPRRTEYQSDKACVGMMQGVRNPRELFVVVCTSQDLTLRVEAGNLVEKKKFIYMYVTHLSRMEVSTIINWTSPYPF